MNPVNSIPVKAINCHVTAFLNINVTLKAQSIHFQDSKQRNEERDEEISKIEVRHLKTKLNCVDNNGLYILLSSFL